MHSRPRIQIDDPQPTLGVTRYDRVSSLLMASLTVLGFVVVWMIALWASQVWGDTGKAVTVELVEIPGGTPLGTPGATLDVDNPNQPNVENPAEVQQNDESLPERQLANWIDALAELPLDLDDPQEQSDERGGRQGSSKGNSNLRSRGAGGTGSGLPREQRWLIYYDPGQTLVEYARMLDFFHIELGAIIDGRLVYVSNVSDTKPRRRSGTQSDDDRIRWLWRGGTRRDADASLLQKAGIDATDAVIMQFLPKDVEEQLAGLERAAAGGRAADTIQRTAFRIRRSGKAYEFYVVEQSFF